MATIDLTPTREEHARIIAYILASHLDGNPNTVVYDSGDYWHFTAYEEDVLFMAYQWLDAISNSLEVIGINLWEMSKATRQRIIRKALDTARNERNQ
jgi:hypothetical protein